MSDLSSLSGDGINFSFFNLLWSKSANASGKEDGSKQNGAKQRTDKNKSPILRVPDTVIFLFGQPHQWYFTSKNGGPNKDRTTILRKRNTNLTLANIEEVFLDKAASGTRRGEVGDDDVVAYFISSQNDGDEDAVAEQPASLDARNAIVDDDDTSCSIEYFNRKSLHKFLQHGRNNKSGILQRFIAPHGGGTHNSQIRAIWTPKLCVLERRRTKQDLHDNRFALYERCITFDGPDVHSVSVPLRGTVLSGRVESICNEIVKHISDVSAENTSGISGKYLPCTSKKSVVDNSFLGVARMVVNFKVDGNGKIWILWSNSIRLQSVSADSDTKLTTEPGIRLLQSQQPLNMETVVRLPASVKLTQAPNHKADTKLDNKLSTATCPSCNKHDANPHFQPVPYKTVIQHFEKTLEMLEEEDYSHPSKVWPPQDHFIKAAGNVGFGCLPLQLERDRQSNHTRCKYIEETHLIPPLIRQMHPKLRAKGFAMYRNDPVFLLKNCSVCEDCFLAYSDLTTMVRPVQPYESEKDVHYEFPLDDKNKKNKHCADDGDKENTTDSSSGGTSKSAADDFLPPSLPPAIMSPPKTANSESSSIPLQPKDTLFNTLPTYFPDNSSKSLVHMVEHKVLADAREHPRVETSKKNNPYEEELDKMIT